MHRSIDSQGYTGAKQIHPEETTLAVKDGALEISAVHGGFQ